uniref:Bm14151 n=1 Tax=Brugia malayi TaxID=6279 RepID=A0A1I9G0T0_BRUMA|nr:Bm14151 [Brugia malayi]
MQRDLTNLFLPHSFISQSYLFFVLILNNSSTFKATLHLFH